MSMKIHAIICGGLLCGATLLTACTQEQQVEWPQVTNEMKPWTRWWWQGNAVRPVDLDSVMPLYQQAGLGGLEITPIYGVHGYEDRFKDFLSSEWVDLFVYTLDKAKELDLGIDLANASGWPFGGPWITAEHASKTMAHKVYHLKGGERLKEPVRYVEPGFVRIAGHTPVRLEQLKEPVTANDNLQELALDQVRYKKELPLIVLTAHNGQGDYIDLTSKLSADGTLDWTAPEGDWTLCALFEGLHGKLVERAGPGGEGDVIDHFSAEAIDAYLAKFDEALAGKDISYLRYYFNDSYEVDDARGESNWTPKLFEEFQKYRGYDLRSYLPALLGEDKPEVNARVRYDYRLTLSDLLAEHYSARWQHWAAKQGKGIRNQAHGSPANILDLYAISDVPEIEGRDLVSIKAASSVAHTEGKKLVSSESATWLNEHFRSNLGDVKGALDLFFLGGVNHIFYHGTCFSPLDAPWPGWLFYAAVHFQPNNPFWGDFKHLNKYVERVQSFLQNGAPDNEVLLYYNIADALSDEGLRSLQHFSGLDRCMMESSTRKVAEQLQQAGYAWDMISDKQLQKTTVDAGDIVTPATRYQTIIVAEAEYIPFETFEKLMALAQEGATVLFCPSLPESVAGWGDFEQKSKRYEAMQEQLEWASSEGVKCASWGKGRICLSEDVALLMEQADVQPEPMYQAGLQCIRRASDTGHYYFIVNTSDHRMEQWIPLQAEEKYAALFQPMDGRCGVTQLRTENGRKEVYLQLNRGEAVILSTSSVRFQGEPYVYYEAGNEEVALNGGWTLTFVQGGPQLPASLEVDSLTSWTCYEGEAYQTFSGTACYQTTIPQAPAGDYVKLDLGDLAENASVCLNGEYVGTVLSAPYELYLPRTQFKGNDTLQVYVANSMANRIMDLDKRGVNWKIFYNVNMSGRLPEDVKNGIFDASGWTPQPSGLFGPVTLTSVKGKTADEY